MSKQRLKEKKKKDREKESKKKVALRREKIRESAREENKEFKHNERIRKLRKEMGELDIWADEVYKNMDEKTLIQLETNAKILKGLEREHRESFEEKQKINDDLESKGLTTLEEKVKYLHDKLVEEQSSLINEMANNCLVNKPIPKKEVSDVEVIKAKN